MDIFSHVLLGFVFGQALQLDTNAQIILIISSAILDVDAISIPRWGTWFQFHRGSLHSILAAMLVSLLIGMGYAASMRLPASVFVSVVSICAGGLFSHIFLDLLTSGGMSVLWPFSSERFTLALTHSFDPIFFGVLLLASALLVVVKNDVSIVQIAAIVAIALLAVNLGVRRHEKYVAPKTLKGLNVAVDSDVMSLPSMRPDRWSVVRKIPFENGYRYEVYNVDSFRNKILSRITVESPYTDYCGPTEAPIDSPQKAVAYSKKDKMVSATIEKFYLPAVNVALSHDGKTWQVFWYDAFAHMNGGKLGISVKVGIDGTIQVARI